MSTDKERSRSFAALEDSRGWGPVGDGRSAPRAPSFTIERDVIAPNRKFRYLPDLFRGQLFEESLALDLVQWFSGSRAWAPTLEVTQFGRVETHDTCCADRTGRTRCRTAGTHGQEAHRLAVVHALAQLVEVSDTGVADCGQTSVARSLHCSATEASKCLAPHLCLPCRRDPDQRVENGTNPSSGWHH